MNDTSDEKLLSASAVRLFGRLIAGVGFEKDKLAASTSGAYRRVIEHLHDPLKLARIYAFSFEGQLYTLPKPTLFLVTGGGEDPMKDTGLANIGDLKFEEGIRRWMFDKDDLALRADVVTGTLDDVLIDATLSPTSDYPIASRGQLAAQGQLALRGQLITRGQMMARNLLRE